LYFIRLHLESGTRKETQAGTASVSSAVSVSKGQPSPLEEQFQSFPSVMPPAAWKRTFFGKQWRSAALCRITVDKARARRAILDIYLAVR
jgi:hypothetical protein